MSYYSIEVTIFEGFLAFHVILVIENIIFTVGLNKKVINLSNVIVMFQKPEPSSSLLLAINNHQWYC